MQASLDANKIQKAIQKALKKAQENQEIIIPDNPEELLADTDSRFSTTLAAHSVDYAPPLICSLSLLLRLKGKAVSVAQLHAFLFGAKKITPALCLYAAQQTGFNGRIIPKKINEILSPMLPCVLLLENNNAAVLTKLEENTAYLIFPENNEEERAVSLEELSNTYTDYAIFGSIESFTDKRVNLLMPKQTKTWFWDTLKQYAPIYQHAFFASIVINIIGVLSPLFVMNVYDRVVPNSAFYTLWVLAAGILTAYIFDFILKYLRSNFVDTAGRNADVVLSSLLINKVLRMKLDHKPESTGALVNSLREFENLREFISSSTLLACIDLPFLILFLFILYFVGGSIVIVPLIAMPIIIICGIVLQKFAKKSAQQNYAENTHKNVLLTEIVNGLETIKSTGSESNMQKRYELIAEHSAFAYMQSKKFSSLSVNFSSFIIQITTVFIVIYGVYLISERSLTMGGLIACSILTGRTMAPLMQIAGLITRFQNSVVSYEGLKNIMDIPNENEHLEYTNLDINPSDISFENVSFTYPEGETPALENISFRIEKGEKIGIIGEMGSGKSTLGKLIMGLHHAQQGSVKLGDTDIRQLITFDYRSSMGYCPQDALLFYGSIRENIVMGDPCLTDKHILRAATQAGVTDFVKNLPDGFSSQVGEQGKSLSGGQRQAVALARALVHNPQLLLLDEPTSNIDKKTESLIKKRIGNTCEDKTLILITHRLSMLRLVQRVILLKNGKIIFDGPKEEALKKMNSYEA